MELLISRQTPMFPRLPSSALEARLTASLRTLLLREGVADRAEISLVLCDDPFIQRLNAQYRGLDKPTDVLSFGQVAPPAPNPGGAGTLFNRSVSGSETPTPPGLGAGGASSTIQGPLILGDIVISLPTASRQAERAGWDLEDEVVLLTVHGGLHLLGYDDETLEGAALMQRKTVALLCEVGIPPPVEGSHPFFVEYP